jgi:hypothetical protein
MKTYRYFVILIVFWAFSCRSDSSGFGSVSPNSGSGVGGSLARFTIVQNHLYVVDSRSLKVFDINDAANPSYLGKSNINAFAETIFPFKDKLLVGTRTGMYIFSIAQPQSPVQVGVFQHFASCDPVVAEGNYAYVTLRNGTPCQRGQNQLDILDISQATNPVLVNSVQMLNPHGLGINGNVLFVCEGSNGLKVFDRTNPVEIKQIQFLQDIKSLDVIPLTNRLIVTGNDGVYQYEYNAKGEMVLLSKLPIGG